MKTRRSCASVRPCGSFWEASVCERTPLAPCPPQEPYPIDMSFAPPCMTLSTIGLSQPGQVAKGARAWECQNHLHQLHVVLPSGKGRTRVLYRMSLDFMPWARGLPFMDRIWRRVADQVLNEDLVLVVGQQRNMLVGEDTWMTPVPYDKLAVR